MYVGRQLIHQTVILGASKCVVDGNGIVGAMLPTSGNFFGICFVHSKYEVPGFDDSNYHIILKLGFINPTPITDTDYQHPALFVEDGTLLFLNFFKKLHDTLLYLTYVKNTRLRPRHSFLEG